MLEVVDQVRWPSGKVTRRQCLRLGTLASLGLLHGPRSLPAAEPPGGAALALVAQSRS